MLIARSWTFALGSAPRNSEKSPTRKLPGETLVATILGSSLDVRHKSALDGPQRPQRGLLRWCQSFHSADIQALVGPVMTQDSQMLAALEIP